MMRTTLDLNAILFSLVNVDAVKSLINGNVYKDSRPLNATSQDVVCTATTVDGDGIQEGVGYVNFHCPGEMPDHQKMKTVTDAITSIVKSKYKLNDYSLVVTNVAGPMKQQDRQEWFMSVRVRVRMYFNR